VTYTVELALALTVEVVAAERGRRGGRWTEPAPDRIELRVRLGDLDVTAALPADVLAGLEDDALERLEDAAVTALLP
jgi:hypothetical protein